eukprot:3423690-Pyramimonas_sp.AAC.1
MARAMHLRVFPVGPDASGNRGRPFVEAVDMLDDSTPQGGLGLEGAPSIGRVLRRWRGGGAAPLTRRDTRAG